MKPVPGAKKVGNHGRRLPLWNMGGLSRVSNLLASLGHTGRKRIVSGHTLNTQTLMKTKKISLYFKQTYNFRLGCIYSHPGQWVGHLCLKSDLQLASSHIFSLVLLHCYNFMFRTLNKSIACKSSSQDLLLTYIYVCLYFRAEVNGNSSKRRAPRCGKAPAPIFFD